MPVSRRIPPLPNTGIPMIDPQTGQMTPQWAIFWTELIATLNEMRSAIP